MELVGGRGFGKEGGDIHGLLVKVLGRSILGLFQPVVKPEVILSVLFDLAVLGIENVVSVELPHERIKYLVLFIHALFKVVF